MKTKLNVLNVTWKLPVAITFVLLITGMTLLRLPVSQAEPNPEAPVQDDQSSIAQDPEQVTLDQDTTRAEALAILAANYFDEMSSAAQMNIERMAGARKVNGVIRPYDYSSSYLPIVTDFAPIQPLPDPSSFIDPLVNNPAADSTSQNTQSETTIVLASGTNVVSAFNDSGSNVGGTNKFTGYSTSANSGTAWTDRGTLPTAASNGDAGDPTMARNTTTGVILFGTLNFNNATRLNVYRSTDDGVTFTGPVNITVTNGNEDKEWLTIDNFAGTGNGNAYMFWRNFGTGGGMSLVRSTDGGLTWSTPPVLLVSGAGQGAQVAVGPDHSVYCEWFTTTPSIVIRRSTDQGVTFGAQTTVTPILSTGSNGDLGLGSFRSSTFPQLVVNPVSGILYTVYPDNPAGADRADVFFRQSTDNGATWSAAVRVNTDAGTNDNWQPALAVAPDGGALFVGWYDRRDSGTNARIEYWGRTATISGSTVTFGCDFPISSSDFPVVVGVDPAINATYMGDYDQATASNTNFYAQWGDNRSGNPDVRFALIPRAGACGTPTPSPSPTTSPTPSPSPTPTPSPAPTPTPTSPPTATPSPTPIPPLPKTVSLPVATVDTATTDFTQPVTTTTINAADNLIGFQGDFTFNENIITFQAPPVSAAGLTASNWTVAGNILPGGGPIRTLRFSGFANDGFTPLSGSGILFNLNMTRVSSTPGANTALTWAAPPNDLEFFDADLNARTPASTPPGSITIVAAPTPSPTPSPTPTPAVVSISGNVDYCSNATLPPVPGVLLTLSGSGSGTALTDGSGNYAFNSVASGGTYTVTPSKTALSPASAAINTTDVLAVQRHFLGITPIPPGCRLTAADVNGDTNVNTTDVIAIQRFFLGFSTGTANAGKYSFSPANRSYPAVSTNQANQNYDALVFGDVASTFVHRPGGISQDAPNELPATVANITLPQIGANQSKTEFSAAVTTSAIDANDKLVGFQGDLTFDSRVITFAIEPVQKSGLTNGNWNVSANILEGQGPIRILRISAFSTDFKPLSGKGTLFELNMIPLGAGPRNNASLTWAPGPDAFIFIDADLQIQRPSNAGSGTIEVFRTR